MATTQRGTRSLLALAAASAIGVGIVSAPTPAQSVVAGDCATAYPVADLAADQAVHGLTVSKGTTPDGFTGTVLGVLRDGIAPGLDMVMVRLTNPEIDRVGGIWAGMSGSPVYAEDGRLIGAVAYGLSWGPSPVAGVTPFEDMNDYLPPPTTAKSVRVPTAAAKKIAAATDVTPAQAEQGFSQLPMPLTVSGAGRDLTLNKSRRYTTRATAGAGSASTAAAGPDSIVAGGNLAFTASTGDITVAAVGTATSVCDDRVVGFGHPATFNGKVTAGMNAADAIYVQEDSTGGAFKVANIGDTAGTITDDHLAGVTGTFGAAPPGIGLSSTVTYGGRSRTGSSVISLEDYAADVTFYELLGNHERVLDGWIPGTEENSWTITGTKPGGAPFTISLGDRYTDPDFVLFSSIWDVPDLVWILGRMDGVTIDSIEVTSDADDNTTVWKLASLKYKKGRTWVPVPNRRTRIQAKAGSTLRLRVGITDPAGHTRTVPVSVAIPAKARKTRGHLHLDGGGSTSSSFWGARTIDQVLARADRYVRNDEVVAYLHARGSGRRFKTTQTSAPQKMVVRGSRLLNLVVR
jgi:hypothetical protein